MNTLPSENSTLLRTVPEITPLELARALEDGEQMQFVDVRSRIGASSAAPGMIPEDKVVDIVGSKLLRLSRLTEAGIDPATPTVVFCGHGNDSRIAAHHLNRLGANARSLRGGMEAWMLLSLPRILDTPSSLDRLVQFDRVGKEALSYVLISSGEALIIDPPRDSSTLLQYIDESQATLVGVADTHVHADYISGGPYIAQDHGIPYYLHQADSVYPYDNTPGRIQFTPVSNEMSIRVGRSSITAVHTPGHSPGSVTYLVGDEAAFTGDFLFIMSVGRPDLAEKAEEWSALLWKSIQLAHDRWPPDLMIYPAHYTSQTPRRSDGSIGESFGQLSSQNPFMRMENESEFLQRITAHVATVPIAYKIIKGINVGLFTVNEREAADLENGKNECAVEGA